MVLWTEFAAALLAAERRRQGRKADGERLVRQAEEFLIGVNTSRLAGDTEGVVRFDE